MSEAELRRAARASGLGARRAPSIKQVDRRRLELWLLSTVLLLGLAVAVVALSLGSAEDMYAALSHPVARIALLAGPVVLSGYALEKELSLRRVARLLQQERLAVLNDRLREITSLLEAGRAVNSTLEVDRVLASILAGATEMLPASRGSVMLLDGEELVVAAAVGDDTALGRRGRVGDGIAGRVADTRQPLLIEGRASRSLFPGLEQERDDVGSALCVPLLERSELLGVLNLSAPVEGDFSDDDLRAVNLFAEQAATAISKARLYERSQQQAGELAHAATHDALTGLSNRAALDARTDRTGGHEALLFLDLDGFKGVNDRLGHAAGDAVLMAVADRLRACVSRDDMVARFGGDEFALLLAGVVDLEPAGGVAERVLAALTEPIEVAGRLVQVGVSIGIAVPGQDRDGDGEGMLQRADRALYAAKAAGKGCWRCADELSEPPLVPWPEGPDSWPAGRLGPPTDLAVRLASDRQRHEVVLTA